MAQEGQADTERSRSNISNLGLALAFGRVDHLLRLHRSCWGLLPHWPLGTACSIMGVGDLQEVVWWQCGCLDLPKHSYLLVVLIVLMHLVAIRFFRRDRMAEAFSSMHHFLTLCSDGADASSSGRRVCYQARHYDRNSSETPPAPEQSSPQPSRSRRDLVGALATIVLCFVTTIASVLQILDLLNLLEMG